jgi:hypothetical protein
MRWVALLGIGLVFLVMISGVYLAFFANRGSSARSRSQAKTQA